MTTQNYSSTITANISATEATSRISRVADWWSTSLTGSAGQAGDTFRLQWGATYVDFAVLEVVTAKRIVWQVTDCNLQFLEDKKEWKGTEVIFDISSDESATMVTMTHVGITPEVECYGTCSKGWDFYIAESLHNLLTADEGFPDMRGRKAVAA